MKILVVDGEDFAANYVEEQMGLQEAYELAVANDGYVNTEIEGYIELTLEVKEFGYVDPAFIKFIRDEIQNYDMSKDNNFYLVDDNEQVINPYEA